MTYAQLAVGDRFIFEGKTWEKINVRGCCNSKYNSVCLDDESTKYFDGNIEVEKL